MFKAAYSVVVKRSRLWIYCVELPVDAGVDTCGCADVVEGEFAVKTT
jgi:hypothetical protein